MQSQIDHKSQTLVNSYTVLLGSAGGWVSYPCPWNPVKTIRLALGCMQVPIRMDQVLLEWEGGDTVVLARFQDMEGSWLCYREMHRKLEASIPAQAGRGGEHRS